MATIPQTNVSISAINTEVDTVSSTSLKTLSDAAKAGSDPKDGAPYGMGEFRGYDHGPSTVTVTYTSTGPQEKLIIILHQIILHQLCHLEVMH